MSKYKGYLASLYGNPVKEKDYQKSLQMYWHLDNEDINFLWFHDNEITMHLKFKPNNHSLMKR